MARRKTTKKPVRRKPAAKSGSLVGKLGWTAAAVLAVGWIASDGRAVGYVGNLVKGADSHVAARTRQPPERTASLRAAPLRPPAESRIERRPAPSERAPSPAARPVRPPVSVPVHTAAIAPSPAPRLAPFRMPKETADTRGVARPVPAAVTLPPAASRPLAAAPVAPSTTTALPAGGMRHATRLLVMRDSPDETGRHIGSVVAGMRVEVMRASGRWRYIKADAGEGWVDGSFLAGELAGLARPAATTPLAVATATAVRFATSAPVPPVGIRNR